MSAKGSMIKFNVHVEPIGDIHLAQCEFTCIFFIYSNRTVRIAKGDMIKVDNDNYTAMVDTTNMGSGMIHMTIEVNIPDSDFSDGYRTEIETVCTGEVITPRGVCKLQSAGQ